VRGAFVVGDSRSGGASPRLALVAAAARAGAASAGGAAFDLTFSFAFSAARSARASRSFARRAFAFFGGGAATPVNGGGASLAKTLCAPREAEGRVAVRPAWLRIPPFTAARIAAFIASGFAK